MTDTPTPRHAPGWQSMETAPKDGTAVLLTDGHDIFKARWRDSFNYAGSTHQGWLIWECDDPWFTYHWSNNEPTLWHPLPQPPKETTDE